MFCSNCGTKLEDNSKFCKNCGNSARSTTEPNKESQKSSSRSFEKVKNFFSINTKTLPTLGILLFLLGIGTQTIHYAVGGITLLIDSAVYKSAKARKLGTVKNSFLRISSKIVALFVLVLILLFQPNAHVVNVEEPIGFFILIWILTAYIYLHLTKYLGVSRKKKIAVAVGIFVLLTFGIQFFPFYYPYSSQVSSSSETQTTKWQIFDSTVAHFKIFFPAEPNYELKKYVEGENSNSTYNQDVYDAKAGGGIFTVERLTFPSQVDLGSNSKAILESLVNSYTQKLPNSQVVSSNFTKYSSYEAIDFLVRENTSNVSIRGRVILVDQSIYRLSVTYPNNLITDSDYNKFADSFQVQ